MKLSSKERKKFKRELHHSRASVIIGKGGAASAMAEVDRQLEDKELIKVKVLKSATDKSPVEIAKEIADATNAEVVEVIGRTFGLFRPKRKKRKEVQHGNSL